MNSLQTNKHGEGAIHVAAGLGQIDILKMLAAKGGNLGMVDLRGDSAIYWSARQGHEDIIKYLLSQLETKNAGIYFSSQIPPCCESINFAAYANKAFFSIILQLINSNEQDLEVKTTVQ